LNSLIVGGEQALADFVDGWKHEKGNSSSVIDGDQAVANGNGLPASPVKSTGSAASASSWAFYPSELGRLAWGYCYVGKFEKGYLVVEVRARGN